MTDSCMKSRFAVSAVLMVLALAGLGVRLAFLHLGPGQKLCSNLEESRTISKEILPPRGNIYDCRGKDNILALNLSVKDVCVDPKTIIETNKVEFVARQLSESLEVPLDTIIGRLGNPKRRFAYIKRFVQEDRVNEIKEKNLPGVFFRDSNVRFYPDANSMCHVLGFVNYEGVGSSGLEQSLDKYLKGSPGFLETRVNALRREMYWSRDHCIPALDGANVLLTLDRTVQYMIEKELDVVMEEHKAAGAWAIVQRVKTGEILAMASRPAFDLNDFRHADNRSRLNRAIGHVYEPGSTFKIATFAAALDSKLVTPDTVINCENGSWLYKRRALRDYHPYGDLSVADGLKKSSNIMSAKLAIKLGEKRFYNYLKDFGVGQKMGIDLPGEEFGILHNLRAWSGISITRIPMGHGVSVTALQMLGIVSAIANDGFLMKPYVVKQISRNDGSVVFSGKPEVLSRPVSGETADVMRKLLGRVTEKGGTGRRARVDGYKVGGKTGTAQKPVAGGYSSTDHMASFVGFLPVEDPEIAIIVVVDTPQPFHTGGVVAGPAFSRIAHQAVRYLDIPPADYQVAKKEFIQ